MDKKQNNYLYKIPQEILFEIFKKLENEDIINIYNCSKYLRNIIYDEVFKYFNFEKNISRKKHFLYKILKNISDEITDDYIGAQEEEKDYYLKDIKTLYDIKDFYKLIIKYVLKCHNCKYIINFENIKHFYQCINCYEYFCENCCNGCRYCDLYNNDYISYYHCCKCKYKCFGKIKNNLKNNKYKKNVKIENIKDIIFGTYIENLDPLHCRKMDQHDFIDGLYIPNEIKTFLKNNSSDLTYIINNNKNKVN